MRLPQRLSPPAGSRKLATKILLPFSATNQYLTPTLGKPLRVIPRYKVLQSLAHGDALIQDDEATYFVMNFGRGADDASGTNLA